MQEISASKWVQKNSIEKKHPQYDCASKMCLPEEHSDRRITPICLEIVKKSYWWSANGSLSADVCSLSYRWPITKILAFHKQISLWITADKPINDLYKTMCLWKIVFFRTEFWPTWTPRKLCATSKTRRASYSFDPVACWEFGQKIRGRSASDRRVVN